MTERWDEPPVIVVRVYLHGRKVCEELCESEEAARASVEAWTELDDVTCEVDDLTVRHVAGQVHEPVLAETVADEY